MCHRLLILVIVALSVLFLGHSSLSAQSGYSPDSASVATGDEAALIPLDSRWEHSQNVTFHPADGQRVDVNPPRMSWPYVPHVRTAPRQQLEQDSGEGTLPVREFTLQICSRGDFTDPEVEKVTDYNFYNALPELAPGRWHWRVQYSLKDQEGRSESDQWSSVRTFIVQTDPNYLQPNGRHEILDVNEDRYTI